MRVPITRDNLSQLALITPDAPPVRGFLYDAVWSPDGKTIAVASAGGAWLYDTLQTTSAPRVIPSDKMVWSVAYSPDGAYFAYLETEGYGTSFYITLRSISHDTVIARLPAFGDTGLIFTPDSSRLIYGTEEQNVAVWDIATQKISLLIPGGRGPLALDPGGKWLLVNGFEGSGDNVTNYVTLWNLNEAKAVRHFQLPSKTKWSNQWFRTATFSPDDKQFVVGYSGGSIYAGDTETGTSLYDFLRGAWGMMPHHIAYSPDGTLIAVARSDGFGEQYQVSLWDAATQTELTILADIVGMTSGGSALDFSPDGKHLLFDDGAGGLHIWDVAARRDLGIVGGDSQGAVHASEITHLSFSPDGKTLALVDGIYNLQLWDVASGQQRASLPYTNWAKNIAFSPDGSRLAGGGRPTIKVWDVHTGQEIASMQGDGIATAYSPDGRWIASGGWDSKVIIWDAQTFTAQHTLTHSGDVWDVAFSPDGKLLASAGGDFMGSNRPQKNEVILWNVETGAQQAVLQGHQVGITGVVFSPDGRRLISFSGKSDRMGGESVIWLWDVATGQAVAKLSGHTDVVIDVAFSPDGRLIASANRDGTIRIWDGLTGAEKLSIAAAGNGDSMNQLSSIAFNLDGTLLVSTDFGGGIAFWNPETGEKVHELRGNAPTSLAFSRDGTMLAVGQFDGAVHIWGISP